MADWKVPPDLKYAKSDEWYRVDGDQVTIGITDYAQDQLSDIVFVELPEVGQTLSAGDGIGVVESVKAASDVYVIVGGEVIEINSSLEDDPEQVNQSPYDDGWFVKIKASDLGPLDDLMDAAAYTDYCNNRE